MLNLGPFAFKVGLLKTKLIETLTDLDKYLMEHMEKRVEDDSNLVVDKVDEILLEVKKTESDYQNIEQVVASKNFIQALPEKKKEIKMLRKAARKKMKILDRYLYNINQETKFNVLTKVWQYPVQIDEESRDFGYRLVDLT